VLSKEEASSWNQNFRGKKGGRGEGSWKRGEKKRNHFSFSSSGGEKRKKLSETFPTEKKKKEAKREIYPPPTKKKGGEGRPRKREGEKGKKTTLEGVELLYPFHSLVVGGGKKKGKIHAAVEGKREKRSAKKKKEGEKARRL